MAYEVTVEFVRLLEEARNGSEQAKQRLHERFAGAGLRAVRRVLRRRARVQFDSTDFTQQVWKDFFAKAIAEQHFQTPEGLVAFLTQVAEKKVAIAQRQLFELQKNNLDRERSIESAARTDRPEFLDPHPSPSEIAEANDEWDHLLQAKPEPVRRALSDLRRGMIIPEIAKHIGMPERSVRRVLHRLAAQCQGGVIVN